MSSDVVIRVSDLGKKYQIRHQAPERYTALRDVITNSLRAPFRRLGEFGRSKMAARRSQTINGSAKIGAGRSNEGHPPQSSNFNLRSSPASREDFWALRDVSFEVKRGDILGIIGRNGAGKSTLLKILSQITEPTEGHIEIEGRVASLLEIGTGFHPELTGRENIFLNGAILGMTRAEIKSRFDQIVDFAEVQNFLDTPVKRYSSGMYVRLAFGVAAHLEPEILVVDEVLAVGDVEFQKKCLGKITEVSKGGRTILFVSHNMAAVNSLTSRSILLDKGQMLFNGKPDAAIEHYMLLGNKAESNPSQLGRGRHTALLGARLLDETDKPTRLYTPGQPLRIEAVLETDGSSSLSFEAVLLDSMRHKLGLASLHQFHGRTLPDRRGCYRAIFELAPLWLASGNYSFDLATSLVNRNWDHYVEDVLQFEVPYSNPGGHSWDFKQSLGLGALALTMQVEPTFAAL